jgi:cysteinyl-tRNA synthetase
MSRALLGDTLDIHGGGLDLQFPHHENELAQSESFTDKPFATYWMHNGLMKIRSQVGKIKGGAAGADDEPQKMSKSLGNEIIVAEVLKRHHPDTLRFLLLSSHYRSPIEYSEERLAELRRGLDGFYRFFDRYQRVTGESFYALPVTRTAEALASAAGPLAGRLREHQAAFVAAMDDDFNTAGAIAALYELLSTLNRYTDEQQLEVTRKADADFTLGVALLRELGDLLGLFAEPAAKQEVGGGDELVGKLVALLIEVRAEARKAKQYALGDKVRDGLKAVGVLLEDRPGGVTDWRRA